MVTRWSTRAIVALAVIGLAVACEPDSPMTPLDDAPSMAAAVAPPGVGCTLTPGYWKTHSEYGPAPYEHAWAKLPNGADTPFFISGMTWYHVFWTEAAGGNAYYVLAHQYMAAKLSVMAGADPSAVSTALSGSAALFNTYTPAQVGALRGGDSIRQAFLAYAETLSAFNEGLIGPGYCSDGPVDTGLYFVDYADSGVAWTFSGLWHVTSGNNCNNSRGCTPGPDEGSGYFWYADPGPADFVDGGRNFGSAIGPAFLLPAGATYPVVRIRTWFEIEYDVSPFSYDFMEIYLVEDGNPSNRVFLGRINGSSYFAGNGTTFGLSDPWIEFVVPIPASQFGKTWHIDLFFDTRDPLYNDYRGWGVDFITVVEDTPPAGAVGAAALRHLFDRMMISGDRIPVVRREPGLTKRD